MSNERWARVQELFHAALDRPLEVRDEFLAAACQGDAELRGEVEALLRSHEEGGPVATGRPRSVQVMERLRSALEGRYEIEREVASGGMAYVFSAEDLKHRRKVAIKVLRPDLGAILGAERFLREIEIAAGLQHPHILPLYDSGAAGGLLYFVMPYVEGDTLFDRLRREGALPRQESVQIAADTLSALEYAHRRGVVHRDIKPANILLSASGGHAVVADFGIARAVRAAGGNGLTMTGALMGTPGYMPPEQAAGRDATPASDIYAVGIVLYECLTGRQWPAPVDLQEVDWSGVPGDLLAVLKRALAWVPEDRWPDAATFRKALLSGTGRDARSKRLLAVAAAAVVLVGAVLMGRTLLDAGQGEGAATADTVTRIAVLPFTVRGSGEFGYLGEGMVDLLSTKLDGAGNWRSVDPRAVLSVVSRSEGTLDPAHADPITERFGADLFVLGNLVEVGGRLHVDASLYEARGDPDAIVHASAEGAATEVLGLVDRVAAQLFAAQGSTGEARLTKLAAVTTASLPALKAYLNGVRDLRAARFPEAAEALQTAVALDSTFALAWYQLSVAADWLLRAELAQHAAEQAVRFSERLAERDRRLLDALYAARRGDAVRAERLYRSIVGTYPEDFEAWSQLGETLFHFGPRLGGSLAEAREVWERVTQLEPEGSAAYVHLARIAAADGDFAGLQAAARRVIELVPKGDRTLEMRTLMAFARNDPEEQARVIAELRRTSDDVLSTIVWSVAAFLSDFDAATRIAGLMTETSHSVEMRAVGHLLLAYLAIAKGQWQRAMAELEATGALDSVAALERRALLSVAPFRQPVQGELAQLRARLARLDAAAVPPSTTPAVWFSVHDEVHPQLRLYLLALISACEGDSGATAAHARELAALPHPPGSGSLVPDMERAIRATVAWRSGRTADALEHIDGVRLEIWHLASTASPFFAQSYERYLRAMLLQEAGRLDEASHWFGSFRHTNVFDLVYLAPSHLRRAEIARRAEDISAERYHYQRAIELWKDADPDVQALLADARGRLSSLGVTHP